jgi:hypothetical protein
VENQYNEEDIVYLTKEWTMRAYVESWGIHPPVLRTGREECAFYGESYVSSKNLCHISTKKIIPIEWKYGAHLRFQYCIVQNERWEYRNTKFNLVPLYKVSNYETQKDKQYV